MLKVKCYSNFLFPFQKSSFDNKQISKDNYINYVKRQAVFLLEGNGMIKHWDNRKSEVESFTIKLGTFLQVSNL